MFIYIVLTISLVFNVFFVMALIGAVAERHQLLLQIKLLNDVDNANEAELEFERLIDRDIYGSYGRNN